MQKTQTVLELKEKADEAKYLNRNGEISYEEMKAAVTTYVEAANACIKELAKEHGVRPRLLNVYSYMR